jgi:hypothetical protein
MILYWWPEAVPATAIEERAQPPRPWSAASWSSALSGLTSPTTWQQVAERFGIRRHTWNVPGSDRGECSWHPSLGCALAIIEAYPSQEQAATYVHELAHSAGFE